MRGPWRVVAFGATVAALATLAAAAGCGDSNSNSGPSGGGGGGGGGGATASQLNIEVQSADVPASGNPTVKFRLTDAAGKPIDDLATEITNDAAQGTKPTPRMTPHFTLGQLEQGGTYTNYYETTVDAAAYTDASGAQQSPSGSAVQPRTEPPSGAFPASQLVSQGNGTYVYTFSPPTTAATKLDRTLTHTVGVYATRTMTETPPGATGPRDVAYPASGTLNFVPGGGTAQKIETVSDAACNTCHTVLRAHDNRQGTQLCITCHAGDRDTPYADPETQNSIDFRVMVHKIHSGIAGYHIVGFRQTDLDFSDVGFPQSILNCTTCHQGANADNFKTKPTATACLSCHFQVKVDGSGTGSCTQGHVETAPCNHVASVTATTDCTGCHAPGGSLGADKVHVDTATVAAQAYKFQITNIAIGQDRMPVVQFQVLKNGAPMALTDDEWTHGSSSRLFLDIGWPNAEYDNTDSGQQFGQPVMLNAQLATPGSGIAQPVQGQTNTYQVTSTTAIPAAVNDVTIALEGHPAVADPYNTGQFVRVPVPNDVKYVNATGGAAGVTRRQVVDVANCNKCHQLLSAHGSNRNGTTQVCVVCHNPAASDGARVPQGGTAEPIDFKVLIHEIHASQIRQTTVTIFGFGGSENVFPLGFPGEVGNCNLCHVNASFQVPLPAEAKDTIIPAGGTTPKTIAVCTACHDQVKFDGSAGSTTCGPGVTGPCNHTGGPQTGDASCAGCHGAGSIADVAKVHPLQ